MPPKTPELPPELQGTYEDKVPGKRYALGCGDDRELTEESRAKLADEGHESLETGAYIRYYGARAGIARVFLVAMLLKGQHEEVAKLGSTFAEAMEKIAARIEETNNVVLDLHTAESNEGNPQTFDAESTNDIGCAYAANAGTLGEISSEYPPHTDLSTIETADLFGNTHNADVIAGANAEFVRRYFPDLSTAKGLTREDFSGTDAPKQVLRGSHAKSADTLVAINFSVDKVSNPKTAAEQGQQFYNNDVTQVAEMLMRAFPEYDFDPETLLRIMDSDIRSTRTALANPEGPEALKVYRIGSPIEAITHLNTVRRELTQD